MVDTGFDVSMGEIHVDGVCTVLGGAGWLFLSSTCVIYLGMEGNPQYRDPFQSVVIEYFKDKSFIRRVMSFFCLYLIPKSSTTRVKVTEFVIFFHKPGV